MDNDKPAYSVAAAIKNSHVLEISCAEKEFRSSDELRLFQAALRDPRLALFFTTR